MFFDKESYMGFKTFGLEYFHKFYSLYRGIVVDNQDPTGHMRLQVIVPSVLGRGNPQWAYPRNIFSGGEYYIKAIPDIGDGIWVEFERGLMTRPIWSHLYPVETPVPQEVVDKDNIFFKTKYGHTIELDGEKIIITHGNLDDETTHVIEMNTDEVLIKHKDGKTVITLAENLIKLNEGSNEGIIIGSKLQLELDKLYNLISSLHSATSKDVTACLPYVTAGTPPPNLLLFGTTELTNPEKKPQVKDTQNENVTH